MRKPPVFADILGFDPNSSKWQQNVKSLPKSEKTLPVRISVLLDGFDAPHIMKSLRFDNETILKVSLVSEFLHQEFEANAIFIKKQLSKIGTDNFSLILKAKMALTGEDLANLRKIERVFQKILLDNQCFSISQLKVDGNDLKSVLGLNGKKVGITLKTLLDAVIYEKCENTKSALLQYAKKNE